MVVMAPPVDNNMCLTLADCTDAPHATQKLRTQRGAAQVKERKLETMLAVAKQEMVGAGCGRRAARERRRRVR